LIWRRGFLLALIFLLMLSFPVPAKAQTALRIAATVNDEMISIFDVNARMTLAIYLSKLANTEETRRRMAPQILRGIIDDKLKMQAAKRQGVTVTQAELAKGMRNWEQRSGLSKGGTSNLARRLGIDKSVIADQVETLAAWRKLLHSKYLSSIQFSDREIDDILAEEESRRGQPEYLVSEIYLPFNSGKNSAEILSLADRLIKQVRDGAPFAALARNFSQSPTAAIGGSLGWVRLGELPAQMDQVIQRLGSNTLSAPIRTLNGVYILNVSNKRAIEPFVERSSEPATVTIYQVHFDLPAASPAGAREIAETNAATIGAEAKSCADMESLGKKFGSPLSGSPGKLKVSQLSPLIQGAISGLPKLTASPPIAISGGILIVMVCDRADPAVKKIDRPTLRRKIRTRLINERLNLAARQFLRSLRRAAIVDVRI